MGCKKCGPSIYNIVVIVIALAIATIVSIFFAQGAIPGLFIFPIIAFIVSSIVLFDLIVMASIIGIIGKKCGDSDRCICCNGQGLLIGTIGTFVASIAAIVSGLLTTLIAAVIFVGLTVFFFTIMILKILSGISCVISEKCY